MAYLHRVMSDRNNGLRQQDWAALYTGSIAAAAAGGSAAARAAAADFNPHINVMQHIMVPGLHPSQLVRLTLEYLYVLGSKPDRLAPNVAGLSFMTMMLTAALGQIETGVCTLGSSERQRFVDDCVQQLWLGLGKQLLCESGVAVADLEGDGSQPAAAAAGDSSMTLKREGVELKLPADVAARMQLVWDEYGRSLFCAIRMYRGGCGFGTGIQSAQQLFP